MGFVLDLILIAIAALCVYRGYKRGFFKSLMSLGAGISALFCSYALYPLLGGFIKENFIIDKIAGSIEKSFLSIARTGGAGSAYDTALLWTDPQFGETVSRYGADKAQIAEIIKSSAGSAEETIEEVSRAVADPMATSISEIIGFIVVFLLAFLLLRVVVFFVGFIFKLPVLRTLDTTLGFVFGIVCGLFFIWVFALCADSLFGVLGAIAPGSIDPDIVEDSFLVGFFADFNAIEFIAGSLG